MKLTNLYVCVYVYLTVDVVYRLQMNGKCYIRGSTGPSGACDTQTNPRGLCSKSKKKMFSCHLCAVTDGITEFGELFLKKKRKR